MEAILTPKQMARLDAYMIERQGIPGLVLMEHAAAAVTKKVFDLNNSERPVLIFCGGGNNGGDGLAVLRQLAMAGVPAKAFLLADPDALMGDAKKQYEMALACKLAVAPLLTEAAILALDLSFGGTVVDAMFGTGLSRAITGRYLMAVERINKSGLPIIAVDIPSGVDGETGRVLGAAIKADATVTFQYQKLGHILFPGRALCGAITTAPIGLPVLEEEPALLFTEEDAKRLLPPRGMNSHKGDFGRGLLCAGSGPYGGAALLCAKAALSGGAGLLKVVIPQSVYPLFAQCPGAIVIPAGSSGDWDMAAAQTAIAAMSWATAVAIGPGMGSASAILLVLAAALALKKPLVIDADGLNALAKEPKLIQRFHKDVILAPHPGELGRLLGMDVHEITKSPLMAAQRAVAYFGCTVLLKGATSVIAAPTEVVVLNTSGNPGLAKGGSGDVLTGLILALLCEGLPSRTAACLGAYLLGAAADSALALLGERRLTPMDVIEAAGATLR